MVDTFEGQKVTKRKKNHIQRLTNSKQKTADVLRCYSGYGKGNNFLFRLCQKRRNVQWYKNN